MFDKKQIPLNVWVFPAVEEIVSNAVPKLDGVFPIIRRANNSAWLGVIVLRLSLATVPPFVDFGIIKIHRTVAEWAPLQFSDKSFKNFQKLVAR